MARSYSVIGTGKLGSALITCLHKAGYDTISLINHHPEKADTLARQMEAPVFSGEWPESPDQLGEVVFICVPDDAIAETARRLSSFDLSGRFIVHTSGTLPASVLKPVEEKGAITAAFHPLQTFNQNSDESVFREIYISLQGDEAATEELSNWARALKARPVIISEEDKVRLHIAAVFASNYLVTLMELAGDVVQDVELKRKLPEMFYPLLSQTVDNLAKKGTGPSLTGPLSRGDITTITRHLNQLNENPELADSYRHMGRKTLPIVERNGNVDPDLINRLRELLSQ